jgi:hypothetical protein
LEAWLLRQWPWNVRELKHYIGALAELAIGDRIEGADVLEALRLVGAGFQRVEREATREVPPADLELLSAGDWRELERDLPSRRALARLFGVDHKTIAAHLRKAARGA